MIFVEVVMWTLLILYYVLTIARLVLHIRDKHKRKKENSMGWEDRMIRIRLDEAIDIHEKDRESIKYKDDNVGNMMKSTNEYVLTILKLIRGDNEEAADE